MKAILPSIVLVLLASPIHALAAQESDATQKPSADRSKLEKELSDRLSNARMTGFYMIDGQNGPPQQDSYTLGKVQKGEGETWVFQARIEYKQKSLMVPLEIPIYWANDTPVITVSDFTIPGMGTYTARVMIHGDHYAGTWSSPTHGGFLWGRIQKIPPGSATESPRQREEKKESGQ